MNEYIKQFIKKVTDMKTDPIKLNQLLDNQKKLIVHKIQNQKLDDLEVLQLQRDDLEKYLEIQFKKIILKGGNTNKIDNECLKETIKSFQSKTPVPITKMESNKFPVTPNTKSKKSSKNRYPEKSFVAINQKQLMNIKLDPN